MNDVQSRLAQRFRKQQAFTAGYSPLYVRLFGVIADWLAAEPGDDPLVDWLVQAATGRSSFDVTLLLLAGLHRDILAGCPEVEALARFYPTSGGTLSPEDETLPDVLREALLSRRVSLAEFVQTAQVQTNETARGLCWLLPVCYPGWPTIHLVDLGASGGLNLVADQRHFRLICQGEGKSEIIELGLGEPVQFSVHGQGAFRPPQSARFPQICSRIGADITPVCLDGIDKEQHLAAFVWGDQSARLSLLRQGIAAVHRINQSDTPLQLHQVDLPEQLPRFLQELLSPLNDAPVVLFNTYLTTYLHDKGASLRNHINVWASMHPQPVLWLQWEPPRNDNKPPAFGWVEWAADLWRQGRHHRWQLAWAHPHGSHIQWLPDWLDWADYWHRP